MLPPIFINEYKLVMPAASCAALPRPSTYTSAMIPNSLLLAPITGILPSPLSIKLSISKYYNNSPKSIKE